MKAKAFYLLILVVYCGKCFGQSAPLTKDKLAQAMPVDPQSLTMRIDDGGFDLLLPSGLQPENPTAEIHSYRSIPALNPPKSAQEVGTDPCSHTLYLAGTGGDYASEMAARGSKKKQFVALPPSGGIAVVEIDDRCVAKMKDEDVLSKLAYEAQQVEGLKPGSRMISYEVDGHPVWLATSTGFSKDEHGKRTAKAGLTLVGNISMKSNGHFFVFGIVANDVELFNRMLTTKVKILR